MTACGTKPFETAARLGFENTIIVQNEELVQEMWDTARVISCDWQDRFEKLITFRPFAVDMLDVTELRFSGDDISCWMDVQLGKGPFAKSVEGIVKIGEEMTVVVYAKDGGNGFDILVKNCYAYDQQNFNDSSTRKLQLIDERGCLLKSKLLGYFFRTLETGSSGADIIAFAQLSAFKFPDKMDVYLSCEVELCKERCEEVCEQPGYPSEPGGVSVLPDFQTTTKRTSLRTTPSVRPTRSTEAPTSPFSCSPLSTDPRCRATTTRRTSTTRRTTPRAPITCVPGSTNPRCTTTPSSTRRPTTTTTCRPGSTDPGCTAPTRPGFVCTEDSLDPRCISTLQPDSSFHSFHTWQYEQGSKRNSRAKFGTRLTARVRNPRNIVYDDIQNQRNLTVNLLRGFSVVSTNDLAFNPDVAFSRSSRPDAAVCMSTAMFVCGVSLLVILICILLVSGGFLYVRARAHRNKKATETINSHFFK